MDNVRSAIIGGTGVYDPGILSEKKYLDVDTPYGIVREVCVGKYNDCSVAFISRHRIGHKTPPHLINYRANIWALKKMGVEKVLATNAVGSTTESMRPGDFVIVDDLVDLTKSRKGTFFEGVGAGGVAHFDMTDPYCPSIREILTESAKKLGIRYHERGVVAVTEGPRFETATEIRDFQHRGFKLVNMTSAPEVFLAREAAMCYASVCMVTNFCTGVSKKPLREEEVFEVMQSNGSKIIDIFLGAVNKMYPITGSCLCRSKDEPIKNILNLAYHN